MTKYEFLYNLRERLKGLPYEDIERSAEYYKEMIEDRVEDGLGEEEAVAALGSLDDIVAQILSETPLAKIVKEKVKPKHKLRAWEIILLILGSPIWIPLALLAIIMFLTVYLIIWTVVVCLFAADVAIGACGLAFVFLPIVYLSTGNIWAGIAFFGAGLMLSGLAIFMFIGVKEVTKVIIKLSKMFLLAVKSLFVGNKKGE